MMPGRIDGPGGWNAQENFRNRFITECDYCWWSTDGSGTGGLRSSVPQADVGSVSVGDCEARSDSSTTGCRVPADRERNQHAARKRHMENRDSAGQGAEA